METRGMEVSPYEFGSGRLCARTHGANNQPDGRRNRDHLYGSRDTQGENVPTNTGTKRRRGGPIQEGEFRCGLCLLTTEQPAPNLLL